MSADQPPSDNEKPKGTGPTLTLKPRTTTGVVRQSFSHGRTKQIVVEKIKRRNIGGDPRRATQINWLRQIDARNEQLDTNSRLFWSANEQDKAFYEAGVNVSNAIGRSASTLNFPDLPALNKVPDLHGLENLEGLSLAWTQIKDISALKKLEQLRILALNGTQISDLSPLSNLHNLEILLLWGTNTLNLEPLSKLRLLSELNIARCPVEDLSPLKGLRNLTRLDISGTKVFDLSPLAQAKSLRFLQASDTLITDLEPIAELTKLVTGAKENPLYSGLILEGCRFENPMIHTRALYPNPDRTVEIIEYLRERLGLPKAHEDIEDDNISAEIDEIEEKQNNPLPLDNIPSPYVFQLSTRGTIALASNPANWPDFPLPTSERDHANRLDTCRMLADDLINDLEAGGFQARMEYRQGLKKYEARLPKYPDSGNILLADAEARTIRSLFGAEADILSPALAAKLKTFLEQHIGLRVFYPEIANFYRDVRTGRVEMPLPLDAIEGLIRGVKENTPTVFDSSVEDAIEGSASSPTPTAVGPTSEHPAFDEGQPMPPRDPLGDVDERKAQEFTIAGITNSLWRAFLEGEKIHKALDGWVKAGDAIRPHVHQILEWLRLFTGN